MLSLASKVTSDDIFYGQSIYLNIEMSQFGMKKMCQKWVKLTGIIWTVLSVGSPKTGYPTVLIFILASVTYHLLAMPCNKDSIAKH